MEADGTWVDALQRDVYNAGKIYDKEEHDMTATDTLTVIHLPGNIVPWFPMCNPTNIEGLQYTVVQLRHWFDTEYQQDVGERRCKQCLHSNEASGA